MFDPTRSGAAPSAGKGFVLVGVVMFVLALTILGISLFGLSTYEAQFYGESSNALQAFYSAAGGIERAKFVLVSQKTLESVTDNLTQPGGVEGVVYARAWFTDDPQDSTGPIDLSSSRLIAVRVLAVYNGRKKMLQAVFQPRAVLDYYKRLVTTSDAVTGLSFGGLAINQSRAFLDGSAMQNSVDTVTWAAAGKRPVLLPHKDPIPIPALSTFFTQHFNDPRTQDRPVQLPPGTYILHGPQSGPPTFFRTAAVAPLPYSLQDVNLNPQIDVKGTAVWMFDKGVRFINHVTVTGQANDCLIIIARDGLFGLEHAGIYFFGGIDSDKVPVILVTDSIVRNEQFGTNLYGSTSLSYVSIFADQVSIIGPLSPGLMTLTHNSGSSNDQPGGLIDDLYAQGALPNPSPGAGLAPVSGQWAELDPDNPPPPY